jgi:hypothetical protein
MDGDVLDDDMARLRELGWSGRLFLSLWSGRLDLGERSEDARATHGGDEFSVEESAAATDGLRFREVQRELRGLVSRVRGSKPKSRGTEIEALTSWGKEPRQGTHWKLFLQVFALDSLVVEAEHHAEK